MYPYQKVAFHTLGCKLNFAETSTIAQKMFEQGYAKVAFHETPDVFVINTCSVTDNANKECRYWVKKALQINPAAKIVIIGCYAQLKPEEIKAIPGVYLVLGAQEKFNVAEHLQNTTSSQTFVDSVKKVKDFFPSYSFGERTRSYLKVQDGCDYFCSFCTIPLARGKSRSATVAQILEKAQELEQKQVPEIVLTGVNVGDFGAGNAETLFDLIRALEEKIAVPRWRISSIEPNLLTPAIIEWVANSSKFMPHFHIPLQSGSDLILDKMRRKYDTALYKERIDYIRKVLPSACIGVDVIVGFPYETEEEFLKTYSFLQELPVNYLHVFTYSERENTTAIKFQDGIVPPEERKKRNKMLQILSEKKKRAFYQAHVGQTRSILFEGQEEDGSMQGFTDNYIQIEAPYNPDWVGKIFTARLKAINENGRMIPELI